MKRIVSLVLALMFVFGAVSAIAQVPYYSIPSDINEIFPLDGDPIQLNVYSQLANYAGIQTGWSAALLKDLFNVTINIIPDSDGTFETRMASGNLGDMVVWGANGADYKNAIEKGMLFNWEEYGFLDMYAPYVAANYTDALESNREISGTGDVYGFGFNVASTKGSHQSFFYSWDLRWDLYKQLGYPEIKDLKDLMEVFKQMKAICPTDDRGNETYAVSVWPDWDGNMVMYVKALATAYRGYDELGIGHYNPLNGEFYDCLAQNSPYMECVQFFNELYRNSLLDPNSMTQNYEQMIEKVKNSGTFWSIFNYAGSMAYNTDEHMAQGRMMYARVPDEAYPITYGLGTTGGVRIWSIGADTAYPDLCLAIMDFLATPEGSMTMWYGPRGLMWDYNADGGMYFTELGKKCNLDTKHDLTGVEWISPYTGKSYTLSGNFNDGCLQINNNTLTKDMVNPDGKLGETFNKDTWVSELTATTYDIQQDWRDYTGVSLSDQYFEKLNHYIIMPDIPYAESEKDDELTVIWNQVTKAITTYTWRAIFAKNPGEYNYHISEMKRICKEYGYEKCVAWSQQEAAIKWALSQN